MMQPAGERVPLPLCDCDCAYTARLLPSVALDRDALSPRHLPQHIFVFIIVVILLLLIIVIIPNIIIIFACLWMNTDTSRSPCDDTTTLSPPQEDLPTSGNGDGDVDGHQSPPTNEPTSDAEVERNGADECVDADTHVAKRCVARTMGASACGCVEARCWADARGARSSFIPDGNWRNGSSTHSVAHGAGDERAGGKWSGTMLIVGIHVHVRRRLRREHRRQLQISRLLLRHSVRALHSVRRCGCARFPAVWRELDIVEASLDVDYLAAAGDALAVD